MTGGSGSGSGIYRRKLKSGSSGGRGGRRGGEGRGGKPELAGTTQVVVLGGDRTVNCWAGLTGQLARMRGSGKHRAPDPVCQRDRVRGSVNKEERGC